MSILCACLITYRPLFSIFNIDFSRLWSTFSRKSSQRSQEYKDLGVFGDNPYLQSPTRTRDARLESLNVKSAKSDLNIVQIDLGTVPRGESSHKARNPSLD